MAMMLSSCRCPSPQYLHRWSRLSRSHLHRFDDHVAVAHRHNDRLRLFFSSLPKTPPIPPPTSRRRRSAAASWQVLGYWTVGLILPCIPIGAWWYQAIQDRNKRLDDVATKVRLTTVQTLDELMIEKCLPGDVVLFDRRCDACAAGPLAALSCWLSHQLLCQEQDPTRTIDYGNFNHCGIIVPGPATSAAQRLDATNLSLLEATASGIVVRPLLQRMEMTKSRCMIVLPLSPPGEQRLKSTTTNTTSNTNAAAGGVSAHSIQSAREYLEQALALACDKYVAQSKEVHYERHDSLLGIAGAIAFKLGLSQSYNALQPNEKKSSLWTYPGPVSPAAWLVVTALQEGGAAENVHYRQALQAKVEDFLRDWRFVDTNDTIRLRPGWRFLPPMILRAPAAASAGPSRRRQQ